MSFGILQNKCFISNIYTSNASSQLLLRRMRTGKSGPVHRGDKWKSQI